MNKTNLIIDILLLTYNNLSNTRQYIEHLYKNTNQEFRIFILDNGSEENTLDYLKLLTKQNSNLYINFQKENLGIIKGRNLCYKFSKEISNNAKYIVFLDNDQFVQKEWLESYLEMMEDFDIVGCEAWQMRDDFYPIKKVKKSDSCFNYVGCGGMLIKKEVTEKIIEKDGYLLDEEYSLYYFEDPSLCWRAYESGYKIGWNSDPIIIHNHSGPLLNNERKQYFIKNWRKFQKKWRGKEIPVFRMK